MVHRIDIYKCAHNNILLTNTYVTQWVLATPTLIGTCSMNIITILILLEPLTYYATMFSGALYFCIQHHKEKDCNYYTVQNVLTLTYSHSVSKWAHDQLFQALSLFLRYYVTILHERNLWTRLVLPVCCHEMVIWGHIQIGLQWCQHLSVLTLASVNVICDNRSLYSSSLFQCFL